MLRRLVICGLIAGLCGGLLAAGFGKVAGEPAIDEAVAYEEARSGPAHHEDEPLVSRGVQSGAGLFSASVIIGLSMGGLFALAFAVFYGRVGRASPARTALWLAFAAFVVVALVPFAKYPANPPAVGDPETIGDRTLAYLTMVAISVLAAIAGVRVRAAAGAAAGIGLYLLVVLVAGIAMPAVNEVPGDFPATTLWDFRVASLGMQLVLWAALGAVFAATAPRVMAGKPIFARRRHKPGMEST